MILVVTGGRDYIERRIIWQAADQLHVSDLGPVQKLIWGGASGGDDITHDWAEHRGINSERYLPRWSEVDVPGAVVRRRRDGQLYNVLAGFARNQEMIDVGRPNHALVLPGGDGTADMFTRVRRAGIAFTIVAPSPRLQGVYNLDEEGMWYRPSPRHRKKR